MEIRSSMNLVIHATILSFWKHPWIAEISQMDPVNQHNLLTMLQSWLIILAQTVSRLQRQYCIETTDSVIERLIINLQFFISKTETVKILIL